MEFDLLQPTWLHWCALGLLLMVLEVATPGVMLIWFGVGALLCSLISWVFNIGAWEAQALIFCVCSVVSVFIGRKLIKRNQPRETGLNKRLTQYIGRSAVLETPIQNGRGRIRLDDSTWPVNGPDLPAGTQVIITHADDVNLVVQQAPGYNPDRFDD